jgi:hypothetical protein
MAESSIRCVNAVFLRQTAGINDAFWQFAFVMRERQS